MVQYSSRLSKAGLVVGYCALTIAVWVAHAAPATGYELSLYRATPLAAWAGVAVALAVGVPLLLTTSREQRAHALAALLVAATTLTVVALPVIRGYYFYAGGDALSHIGWTRELVTGALSPLELLYPGIHATTAVVASVTGTPLVQANLYVVLVGVPAVFLLFVPLTVQLLVDTPSAYAVGLLAACLFTPVNNIAVHLVSHPASQAILLLPVALYLALAYAIHQPFLARRQDVDADAGWPPRPGAAFGYAALFTGVAASYLLVHPQQALNLAFCLLAITGLQLLVRWRRADSRMSSHRVLHVHAFVTAAAFLAWAPRFERVQGAVVSTILSIVETGGSTGEVVSQKSGSLLAVGGSLPVLFVKLFVGATVVSLLAAFLILTAIRGGLPDRDTNTVVTYLSAALVPVTGIFLVVLASSAGDMYFRYQGFIMVPVTVLGAAALAYAVDRAPDDSRRVGVTAALCLFCVLVPVGMAALHPAPFIYQPSKHVSDSQASGYESAFEYRQPDVPFSGIRGGPERYVDFYYGTEYARTTLDFPGYSRPLPEPVFERGNYTAYFDDAAYFAVTQSDYEREVQLYEGFRYSRSGFESLATTPGVNRVRASDGFRLYWVAPTDP